MEDSMTERTSSLASRTVQHREWVRGAFVKFKSDIDLLEKPALSWCTKERCEQIVAMQEARGLSFNTEIQPSDLPQAPEWAYQIRYFR